MIALRNTALSALWIAGLLLAGSNGPLFPWLNLAGLILFALFTAIMCRMPLKTTFKGR